MLLFISYTLNAMADCDNYYENEAICSSKTIGYEGFSCYKVINNNDYKCITFPDNKEIQKLFFQQRNGIVKEFHSAFPVVEGNEDADKPLFEGTKDKYEKGETIETKDLILSDEDKIVLKSKNTCAYYNYGRVDSNPSSTYPDITDKNICFNAKQFNDLKNLIDCGYATITFITPEKNYIIKTCYYINNKKMPSEFIYLLREHFFNIESGVSIDFLSQIFNMLKGDGERRKLSDLNYEAIVEDKNGRKIKYTNDDKQFRIISEGNEEEEKGSKGVFIKFNILLLLSLLILWC